jgi:hypothetical protein
MVDHVEEPRVERGPTPLDIGPAQALVALATGAWRQAVLAVAVRLDLCAMLGARDADLEEVCYSLGTRRQPMRLFLAACEGVGLVVARDDAFRLGPLGQALRDVGGEGPAAWARATGDVALADALEAALVEPLLSEPSAAPWTGPAELPSGPPEPSRGWAAGAPASARGLGARLPEPGAGSPAGTPRPGNGAGMPTADDWEALHAAAAAALAAALPLPAEGLALEIGGRGTFLRACLGRAAGLSGALVAVGTPGEDSAGEARGAAGAAGGSPRPASGGGATGLASGGTVGTAGIGAGAPWTAGAGAGAAASGGAGAGAAPVSDRFVEVPALEALGTRPARLALVVHAVDAGGAVALRAGLTAVRDYLAPDAWVVVVGDFLPPTPERPLAPLLGLVALASGRAAWCPTIEIVAEHLRASGYELTETLVLPEPAVALLAHA